MKKSSIIKYSLMTQVQLPVIIALLAITLVKLLLTKILARLDNPLSSPAAEIARGATDHCTVSPAKPVHKGVNMAAVEVRRWVKTTNLN